MRFARQHPGVGDITVHAGAEKQKRKADRLTFRPESLAGQPVRQLMQNLERPHDNPQRHDAVSCEQAGHRWQLAKKRFYMQQKK